jgi:hypothetical protein
VFGAVVEGMGVLKRMEAVGSKSGVVARRVTISNCGQLESKLQRALKVAAERAENEEYMNDPLKVDVDGEAAARLKRLRGEEPSKSEDPGNAGVYSSCTESVYMQRCYHFIFSPWPCAGSRPCSIGCS